MNRNDSYAHRLSISDDACRLPTFRMTFAQPFLSARDLADEGLMDQSFQPYHRIQALLLTHFLNRFTARFHSISYRLHSTSFYFHPSVNLRFRFVLLPARLRYDRLTTFKRYQLCVGMPLCALALALLRSACAVSSPSSPGLCCHATLFLFRPISTTFADVSLLPSVDSYDQQPVQSFRSVKPSHFTGNDISKHDLQLLHKWTRQAWCNAKSCTFMCQ